MRSRLFQIVALGALALAIAGTAQGTAEPPTISTLTVQPGGGHYAVDHQHLSVIVDLRGETSAPRKISIHAPNQFHLGPQRDEGTPVGRAEIHLRNGHGPLLRYTGTISAAPIAVAVAARCSTDALAGAWIIRASLGKRKLELPISLTSGAGTRLDLCPAAGQRVAALALFLAEVQPPATPGSYGWNALVTPRSTPSATYELRAIVPVPHVLTLRGSLVGFDRTTSLAHLTGTLRAHGKPRQRTEIDIVRLDRTAVPLAFYDSWDGVVDTTTRGGYTIYLPLTRTQGFVASTPPTVKRCSGPSVAPAGCKTITTAGTESDPVTVSVP